jgi:hypothetical protein
MALLFENPKPTSACCALAAQGATLPIRVPQYQHTSVTAYSSLSTVDKGEGATPVLAGAGAAGDGEGAGAASAADPPALSSMGTDAMSLGPCMVLVGVAPKA